MLKQATREELRKLKRKMGMKLNDRRRPSVVVAQAGALWLEQFAWSNGSLAEAFELNVDSRGMAVCAVGAVNASIINKKNVTGEQIRKKSYDAADALVKAAFPYGVKKNNDPFDTPGDSDWLVDFNDHSDYDTGSIKGKRRVQKRLCRLATRLAKRGL